VKRRGLVLLLFTTLMLFTFRGDGNDPAALYAAARTVSPEEVLEYFCEIAFGSELGESAPFVTKWVSPISIAVCGSPRAADLALIDELTAALNAVEGFPGITPVETDGDLTVFFLTPEELEKRFSLWQKGDGGTVEYVWNRQSGVITKATVGIDRSLTVGRAATVAEEILQALGLGRDSLLYEYSVFYDKQCPVDAPTELDWALVRLLYHPSVAPGMTKEEVLPRLEEILGIGAPA